MKISHIEHLGIAVKSIEEALPYYENVLGLKNKLKIAYITAGGAVVLTVLQFILNIVGVI